ncbi:hypothetical protein AGMMS4957_08590 [Bacteroidia bacterium]|nr:hypothetical protein AGMMS4957_08590 [Bacteroidia bacterium]
MIYLIDDNNDNQRVRLYNITYIDTEIEKDKIFKDCLTSIKTLAKREKDDLSHLECFKKDAECILVHLTTEDFDEEKGIFVKGSTDNVTKIIDDIAQEGREIPLVLFSNSMGEPIYYPKENPNYIKSIKKNLFYARLRDFMEYYKNSGDKKTIDLRILAWGKNYQAKEASMYANIFMESIIFENGNDLLKITNLSVFESFLKLSFPNANEQVKAIVDDLENITVSTFRNKINLITESFWKYGKNIHSWK